MSDDKSTLPAPDVKPPRRRRWPRLTIDLSRKKHRAILTVGVIFFLALGGVLYFATTEVVQYTESRSFCGTTCHPMLSTYARYTQSEHAAVACVHCHVGAGQQYFIKSKIEGIRQVFAMVNNSYEKPIPSPVNNLRPARETCEDCHRPASFRDNKIKIINHYGNDEKNTPSQTVLILKLGGTQSSTGVSKGIHWHIQSKVSYIAEDEKRQVISWVGVEENGQLKEFYARDSLALAQSDYVEKARREGRVREMDCIDCHNRAAHFIPSPQEVVDQAIKDGKIDRSIPFIRQQSVAVLTPAYPDEATALKTIAELETYYQTNYTSTYETFKVPLQQAIVALKDQYLMTAFPDMNLNWQSNPNNAAHRTFPGCFRCHDDNHVMTDANGTVTGKISAECNLCHTVPIVGSSDKDVVVEAPVIVGDVPESHKNFSWTLEHRSIDKSQEPTCYGCHGQNFCQNAACHNLSHPPDMLFSHPDQYRKYGDATCFACHQNVTCARCHPGGIIKNP